MPKKLRLYPMYRQDTAPLFVSPELFKPIDMVVDDSVYNEPFQTSFLKPGRTMGLFSLCIPHGSNAARCTDEILAEDLVIDQLMFKYIPETGAPQIGTTGGFTIKMSDGKSEREMYVIKGNLNIYDYINTFALDGSDFQIPRGGIDLPLWITYNKKILTLDIRGGSRVEDTTTENKYQVELLGVTFAAHYEKTGVNVFTPDE